MNKYNIYILIYLILQTACASMDTPEVENAHPTDSYGLEKLISKDKIVAKKIDTENSLLNQVIHLKTLELQDELILSLNISPDSPLRFELIKSIKSKFENKKFTYSSHLGSNTSIFDMLDDLIHGHHEPCDSAHLEFKNLTVDPSNEQGRVIFDVILTSKDSLIRNEQYEIKYKAKLKTKKIAGEKIKYWVVNFK